MPVDSSPLRIWYYDAHEGAYGQRIEKKCMTRYLQGSLAFDKAFFVKFPVTAGQEMPAEQVLSEQEPKDANRFFDCQQH